MIKFKDRPIKSKLTIFIMISTLLAVAALSSAFVYQRYISFKQQMTDEFTTITKIIADRSNAAVIFQDNAALSETLSSLSLHKYVLNGCTYNIEGVQLAQYQKSPQNLSCPEQAKQDPQNNKGDVFFSNGVFYISEPIIVDGEMNGLVYIRASTEKLTQEITATAITALGISSILFLVAFLFARYIQRFISDPLIQLKDAARKVSIEHGSFPKLHKKNDNEIGTLVDAFNSMLDTISEQNKIITEHASNLETKVNERTEELAIANKELEAFSYSVSHDLKAPLRIIDGFSRALEEDYGDQLDETAQDYLSRVRIGSYKMSQLITNLLQLSKVTRQELIKDQIDLSKLCEKAINTLCDQEPDRPANFEIDNEMTAMGDSPLVEILLDNLIGNAWKYSRKEASTKIEIGCKVQQGNPVYFVRDNGTGFDMKYANQLFKPFKRLHSAEEFEGTGIGLATVGRIIERHRGKIWAESELNKGTTFYFTLFPASSNNDEGIMKVFNGMKNN